jgi:glycosyltransferase involved in cell wall biosynthesis
MTTRWAGRPDPSTNDAGGESRLHHGPAVDQTTPDSNQSLTTVVLCTTGQSRNLARAIKSVLAQNYQSLELLVVDNRPASGRTRETVQQFHDPRLRYVVEPTAGLSIARNTGIRHARGTVIAFTDDDCIADSDWINTIRGIFDQYPRIVCVTGKTIAFGDLSHWERLFEEFGSFDRGDQRVVWRRSTSEQFVIEYNPADDLPGTDGRHSPIYPYTGVFGSGNNMAFRTSIFAETGFFDEALGAGTPSGGGEDLDMFIRLVLSDRILAFEPTALIRHQHRASGEALRTQIRTYGSGLSAMITKQLMSDRDGWKRVARRIGPGVSHLFRPSSNKNIRKSSNYPLRLTLTEWYGVALGPWLYFRGRRAVRKRRRSTEEMAGHARSTAGGR